MEQVDRAYPDGATEKFRELERRLHTQVEGAEVEARKQADEVCAPETATADILWPKLWDKPIHAGTNETAAKNTVRKLRAYFDNDWRQIFRTTGDYAIAHNGSKNANASFIAHGKIAKEICRADDDGKVVEGRKGLLARARYYAIVSAAEWLRQRESIDPFPMKDMANQDLRVLVPDLEAALGLRWKHITVLHFLTDLGMACKPDLHLTTTAKELGFTAIGGTEPNRSEALQIVQLVKTLANQLGDEYPLRYVDKTMFQISKLLWRTPEPVRASRSKQPASG